MRKLNYRPKFYVLTYYGEESARHSCVGLTVRLLRVNWVTQIKLTNHKAEQKHYM